MASDELIPTDVTIRIKGKNRILKYNFSAWKELEKKYEGKGELFETLQKEITEKPFQTIPYLIFIGCQDKEGITEDNILDEYGLADVKMLSDKFYSTIFGSLPKSEEKKTVE